MLIKLRYNATALTKILNEPKEQQVLMYLCNKKISKVLIKRFYGNIPLMAEKLYILKDQEQSSVGLSVYSNKSATCLK